MHIRHQEKPDSWKGKDTTPICDEFMTEVRKEYYYFDSKDKCQVSYFFCSFNHLLQLLPAIAATGLWKTYCASKRLLIKITHLKIMFCIDSHPAQIFAAKSAEERAVEQLLWLPASTSVSSAGCLLWCHFKEKARRLQGGPAQRLPLSRERLEITILVWGSYLTFLKLSAQILKSCSTDDTVLGLLSAVAWPGCSPLRE